MSDIEEITDVHKSMDMRVYDTSDIPTEEKIVILMDESNISVYTQFSKKVVVLDKLTNDSVYQDGEDVITVKREQYRFLNFSQAQGDATEAIYNDVQRQRIETDLKIIKQRLEEISSEAHEIITEEKALEAAQKQALEKLKNLEAC